MRGGKKINSIVCFVPVMHAGYLKFFKKYAGAKLFLVGEDLLSGIEYFSREIRALKAEEMKPVVEALKVFSGVEVLNAKNIKELNNPSAKIVMPDEDITRHLAEKYFPDANSFFENIFLRWHQKNVSSENKVDPDRIVSTNEFDMEIMGIALNEAEKSSDWWRQIGAIAVKDKNVLITSFNKHMPSPHMPYANGDPRTPFSWGERIDLSSAAHAEAGLIAHAANKGISLGGASLYVTTFPCPACAYSVALSGIKKLYYAEGYSLVDAAKTLNAFDVKIIKIEI